VTMGLSEDSGNRGFVTKCYPGSNNFRYRCGHIDSGYCNHPHNRVGNPLGSSSCNRSGLRNSRYNHSLRPYRHKSLCNCRHANGRRGLPFRRENLLHNHISPPGVTTSHHIRWFDSTCRHDCNDRSARCRNTDHYRSQTDGPANNSAAAAGALDTLVESDTGPCAFVAVTALHALVRDVPPVPDVAGTALHFVAAL